jgi:methionyl-tRNA synthetase
VVVHGFLTVNGRKIGKSLGNGVDPFELVERFGRDRLRYYLLRYFPLGRDGDFSVPALVQGANAELSDQLGNLLNRVLVLLEKHAGGAIPELLAARTALSEGASRAAERAAAELERAAPDQALAAVIGYVAACNLTISQSEPWKLARGVASAPTDAERLQRQAELFEVLGDLARALLWIAGLLEPFLPEAAARIARALGAPAPNPYRPDPGIEWSTLLRGAKTQRGEVLFARLDA